MTWSSYYRGWMEKKMKTEYECNDVDLSAEIHTKDRIMECCAWHWQAHECRLTDINTSCCAGKTTPVFRWYIQKHELWLVAASCFRKIKAFWTARATSCILQHTHTHPPPLTIITLPRCPDWATARDPVDQRRTEEEKICLYSLELDSSINGKIIYCLFCLLR